MITTAVFWATAVVLLAVSAIKDKAKTRQAVARAGRALLGILPQLVAILVLVSVVLALADAATVGRLLGATSGMGGVLLASVVGSVTLIPGVVAFPTAAMLIHGGAGYVQIAAFISTLMMVGVVTLPAEIAHFNARTALLRNALAYLFSLLAALVVGAVMAL